MNDRLVAKRLPQFRSLCRCKRKYSSRKHGSGALCHELDLKQIRDGGASGLTRRLFVSGAAALMAAPAIGAKPRTTNFDVVIIGAGAAGIAAGRRMAAAKKSFIILEASDRTGGRCITDTTLFGLPFDLGAHRIDNPVNNPLLTELPKHSGLDVYQAPETQRLRMGRRNARTAELENFVATLTRARRAIADVTHAKTDMPASNLLPTDLGDWRGLIEFILGPYTCGKDLEKVSALDLALAREREKNSFCRQGYGALLATLTTDLPIQLSTPATKIRWDDGLLIETNQGNLRAEAAIVTASTNVLVKKIAFSPALPFRHEDAASRLSLGSFDHIALEIPGNPLDLRDDDLVFEQPSGSHTAALHAKISDSALYLVEVGGEFGRNLSAQGQATMIDFAREWLALMYGSNIKKLIRRNHVTRWNHEPWILGAMSAAAPGQERARRILMEPVGGRIFFAGEAAHETRWGTVTGAWESGIRAAELALRWIGTAAPAQSGSPKRLRRKRLPPQGYR